MFVKYFTIILKGGVFVDTLYNTHVAILCHFRHMSYLLNITNFSYSTPFGVISPRSFASDNYIRDQQGTILRCLYDDCLAIFDRKPAYNRGTDRRTD